MKDRIVISPTSRQEGHAELVMEVDDEGIVTKGRYLSITPVRGLEKMVAGKNPETGLVEALELKNHPFYVGVQYHPEYKSTVANPHPLFKAL